MYSLEKSQKILSNKIFISALNLAILVCAVYWSSKGTYISTYDKYAIELNEVVISVRDIGKSEHFYVDVLGFKRVEVGEDVSASNDSVLLDTQGHTKLRLEQRYSDGDGPKNIVRFKIENDIDKLHVLLCKKINNTVQWDSSYENTYESAMKFMKENSISHLISGKKKSPILGWKFYRFFVLDSDGNLLEYSYR